MIKKLFPLILSLSFSLCFSESDLKPIPSHHLSDGPIGIVWIDIKEKSIVEELSTSHMLLHADVVYVTVSMYTNHCSRTVYREVKEFLLKTGYDLVDHDFDEYFPYSGLAVFVKGKSKSISSN